MTNDSKHIAETVQLYFTSYLTADSDGIARAFHEDTRLLSVDQGQMERTDLSAWLPSLRLRREKGDVRKAEAAIESIDVAGDAAIVKARLRFKEFSFIDYLSLLKIQGSWKIVGKIYTTQPAATQPASDA